MAVLPNCPGLRVEVFVDDEPLTEYGDVEDAANNTSVVKYVEAIADATFRLRVFVDAGFSTTYGLKAKALVDGSLVGGCIVPQSAMDSDVVRSIRGATSRINGTTMIEPFQFSDLKTSEEMYSDLRIPKELGQIVIKFYYVTNIRVSDVANINMASLPSEIDQRRMPQKATIAKSLSHYVSRGKQQQRKTTWYDCDRVTKKSFAEFVFRYRSSRSLQNLGVIPHTPSPATLPRTPTPILKQRTPDAPQNEILATPNNGTWSALPVDALRALLNHYTGQDASWDGLDRSAMEALLNHYSGTPSQGIKTKPQGKGKRSAPPDPDDDEVVITEERPRKRLHIPGAYDEVITLD